MPGFFLHACARTDHSVSKIIIFKSAAGSISFRSTVSQSCSIHACVGGPRPRAGRASALRWRCRRLAAACPVRLVGDIRHATAVVHKVFGQENKPGAPVTSSQGARDTNVRPPNRAWEERSFFPTNPRPPTLVDARAQRNQGARPGRRTGHPCHAPSPSTHHHALGLKFTDTTTGEHVSVGFSYGGVSDPRRCD